jgi:hypothetical protein
MNPLNGLQGAGGAGEAKDAQQGNQLADMAKELVPKLLEGGAEILKTIMPQLAPIIDIIEKAVQGLGATAEEFSQASKALEDPETVDQMNKAMG